MIVTLANGFPVYLHLGWWRMHPHWVFETLGYAVAFRVYLWIRRQFGDALPDANRWWVICAAACGALAGSKILYWFEDPRLTLANLHNVGFLIGGKTIVGALIGGLIAVELMKRYLGITRRTGDLFAVPLCVGICIGRIGCFLTGLDDHTFGTATSLPWGVNFGAGSFFVDAHESRTSGRRHFQDVHGGLLFFPAGLRFSETRCARFYDAEFDPVGVRHDAFLLFV